MLRSSELRIGNWVKIKEEFSDREFPLETLEFQIMGFNDGSARYEEGAKQILFWKIKNSVFGITHSGSYDIDCEPIPLTEEWLLKFGAIINHNKYYNYDKFELKRKDLRFSYFLEKTSSGYFNIGITQTFCDNIKYVHQLQNLYFALTGEELTIKE